MSLSRPPPMHYKPSVDVSNLKTVELSSRDDDGNKRKKHCPVFDGKGGVEVLLDKY